MLVDLQEVARLLLPQRLLRVAVDHIHADRCRVDPNFLDKFEAVPKIPISSSNHNGLEFGERYVQDLMYLGPAISRDETLLIIT